MLTYVALSILASANTTEPVTLQVLDLIKGAYARYKVVGKEVGVGKGAYVPVVWETALTNYSSDEIAEVTVRFIVFDRNKRQSFTMTESLRTFEDEFTHVKGCLLPHGTAMPIKVQGKIPHNANMYAFTTSGLVVGAKAYRKADLSQPEHLFAFLMKSEKRDVVGMFKRQPGLLKVRSSDGLTPVLMSARQADPTITDYLVKLGGNLKARTKSGLTAMHLGALSESTAMIAYLRKRGVSPSAHASDGQTPLHFAAAYGDEPVVRELLAVHADVNAKDRHGERPIVSAIVHGQIGLLEILVKGGSSLAGDGLSGLGAMQAAATVGTGILEEVWRLGGQIDDSHPPTKMTPLHAAVKTGKIQCVVWLLEHGADPAKRTAAGESIYDLAFKRSGDYYRNNLRGLVERYSTR